MVNALEPLGDVAAAEAAVPHRLPAGGPAALRRHDRAGLRVLHRPAQGHVRRRCEAAPARGARGTCRVENTQPLFDASDAEADGTRPVG